ncbi:cytochrome b5 domain-containing protein 1 [Terrapene carolina triunguis]|uniref:Cytochrome b5 domain-containing protein 1 n=1 Tax=Terrapene triunguis TaxID=2587831 RepID=A0A674J6C8_9SAUR|nr:cytochrome b5 domain-containing protein 1 [Terrapene carolina triunguis]
MTARAAGGAMEKFQARYFTPREVSAHAQPGDLWVSYLGRVYDLSPLVRQHKGDVLLRPILEAAGKDISHWFNPKTRDIQTHVDPLTGCVKYYTPQGRFIHISPQLPRSDWANDFGLPWWKDSKYEVGILASKTRRVRIVNTLTSQEHVLEVCAEESMWEILRRYLPHNAHAASYTWKYEGVNLDMDKTLEQNKIPDEDAEFYRLNLDADLYTPGILLYFNDDLTEF